MKKNTLLYVGLAGAAAYFLFARKNSQAQSKAVSNEIATEVENATGEEVSAVIKTPAGQISQGIEQAKQIAETVKSGVVAVKDIATGTTAVVRAEKRTAKKATRATKKAARKAKRTTRKATRQAKRAKRATKRTRTQPGEYQRVPLRDEFED
jgi:colicin import membrane protein